MLLAMLKRAVKMTLHDAVEEWAMEVGLPRPAVEEMRSQRLVLTAQAEAAADARAALALRVEDDAGERPTLPMLSAARVTTTDAMNECPRPGDEPALLHWVHRQ